MSISSIRNAFEYLRILSRRNLFDIENKESWSSSLQNPTSFYLDAFRYFYFNLPGEVRSQKKYFRKESRGFGENTFHTMWYLLYEKYKFSKFLEIGVYRGQILHLIGLIAKLKKTTVDLYGISPFDNSGDSQSRYLKLDYQQDVLNHFHKFSLKEPTLLKSFSTDEIALELISSQEWDCIYIDGSHDLEIVEQDWKICKKHVTLGGIIVLDDASLYTNYNPPFFAFKGHPGPSKIGDRVASKESDFVEILRVGHNRVFERVR